jgi:restriction endonuclease S subunit
VLLAIKGASIASDKSVTFISNVDTETIVNGTIFRFQVNKEHNPFYVAVMLDSEIMKRQIRNIQISNNAVAYLDKPSIHALQIPLPPRPTQNKIAEMMKESYRMRREKLREADNLITKAKKHIEHIIGGK